MTEPKKSILDDMRRKITSLGGSEFDAVENQPALQEMWNQLQVLREEMNEAKKAAAAEAAKPYQETINQIESKYAFMLRMVS